MDDEKLRRAFEEKKFEDKKFLLAVERGDVASVRRYLERSGPTAIDINCVDPLGRSALLMAIDNENLQMVELLLEHQVQTKDALLHAINEEYVEAVELLLEHEEAHHTPGQPHSWEAIERETASFTPDITPLTLAAHRNNYEILKILLDRGSSLPQPHDCRCCCGECVQSKAEDSLRHSRSRINRYRALSSPSLIALTSKDPIVTAFELSWELRRLSFLEQEFKNEYQELRRQCSDFATALLDHTRSSYELEVLLNYDPTGPAFEHGDRMHLNRLKLAIKYKQKRFCAHSNVQQLLASIWYEGLPGFRRKNIFQQMLLICRIGVLFPLYSTAYVLAPRSPYGRILRRPFVKFICHSASYVTFLFLLILASQRVETVISDWFGRERQKITADDMPKRGATPSVVEWMILAWVAGLIWSEIKQLWAVGLADYANDMWNIIDFITQSLYVATVALRIVAYFQVQKEIVNKTGTAYLPREKWDAWDPILISEGLFSAANIFSSLKLVYIFSVNPHLGPLQISLGRMVIDIVKFFFVYTLVLFSFACGMNQLLWYYADMERQTCASLPAPSANRTDTWSSSACYNWRRFSNLFESSQTLFWASFGLVDLESFELTGIQSYTRFWGMLMFGSYCVINVVVLLNLLIAMMNHSYQMISEHADVEWKFARSKLWMSYFEDGATAPPPFNIIPTCKSAYYLFRWIWSKLCGQSRTAKKEHLRTIRRKAKQASEKDIIYQTIMYYLVRRYVTTQQRIADNQGVTEDDVNEIKQDISSFRYELMEILRVSGFNTSSATGKGSVAGGKKGRQRERRLMKGFNIGLVEAQQQLQQKPSSPLANFATAWTRHQQNQQGNKRGKWRSLVEATRSARSALIRSRSDDSATTPDSPCNSQRSSPSGSTISVATQQHDTTTLARRLGTLTFSSSRLRLRLHDESSDKVTSHHNSSKTSAQRTVSAPVKSQQTLEVVTSRSLSPIPHTPRASLTPECVVDVTSTPANGAVKQLISSYGIEPADKEMTFDWI